MTITATRVTQTDEVLVDMLTENTGRHFLDSGGAYGRAWERNQGRDLESFVNAPAAWFVESGEYVVVDVFHWLRDRLEYDPIMDRKFRLWDATFMPDAHWLESLETFAAKVVTGDAHDDNWASGGWLDGGYNSYNHEESLSQTIQFTLFTDPDGETWCGLQIHGGCDVRGGYTAPRIFRVMGYDGAADMLDFDCFELDCTREEPQAETLPGMPEPERHSLSHRNGELVEWTGSCSTMRDLWPDGDWTHETEDGEKFIRCPYCETPTPMAVYPYPVG